jgi:6-phosphogluconate dehydrogenase
MQLGMIGLGRMGANMVRRLMRHGHQCVVYDRDPDNVAGLAAEGAVGAADLQDLVKRLAPPRAVWIMVPAGAPTQSSIDALCVLCSGGDAILDGGNSFYKDDIRRAAACAARGIQYIDVGTSGGVWGLERGYCLMIGGERSAVERLDPIFRALAPGRGEVAESAGREGRRSSAAAGYLHCGPPGAGHFVKMIHNGIEYGLMQAYAEGFDILRNAPGYDLDLADVAELWRRGSVVTSWLLDLSAAALAKSPRLEEFVGAVPDSGEGRWTIETAIEQAVPADVLAASLFARFRSRQEHTFAEKMLSAMRHGFGGHAEEKPKS